MDIICNVTGQKLEIVTPLRHFAQNSSDFIRFLFTFREGWDGLMIFAQFRQHEHVANVYLSDVTVEGVTYKAVTLPGGWAENTFWLPGPLTMTLYGTGRETVVGTTNYVLMMIDETGFVADGVTSDITETLYEQMVNRFIQHEWRYDMIQNYQGAWEALTAALDESKPWGEIPVTPAETAPASPADGDYWYDTANDKLYRYDGTATEWVELTGKAADDNVPPDVFYYMDTAAGKLYRTPIAALPVATDSTVGGIRLDSGNFKIGTGANAGKLMLKDDVAISGDFYADGDKKLAKEYFISQLASLGNDYLFTTILNILDILEDKPEFIRIVKIIGGGFDKSTVYEDFAWMGGDVYYFDVYYSEPVRNSGYLFFNFDSSPQGGNQIGGTQENPVTKVTTTVNKQVSETKDIEIAVNTPHPIYAVIVGRKNATGNAITRIDADAAAMQTEYRASIYDGGVLSTDIFELEVGAVTTNGEDNSSYAYPNRRRRSKNDKKVYLYPGVKVVCSDNAVFMLYRYNFATSTEKADSYDYGTCQKSYRIVDKGWYRISLKRADDDTAEFTEEPTVSVLKTTNMPVEAYEMAQKAQTCIGTYTGTGLFIQAAIARAGTFLLPSGTGDGPAYAARAAVMEHFVRDNVVKIAAAEGYKLSWYAYDHSGNYVGYPKDYDVLHTYENGGTNPNAYRYQEIDMISLRKAVPGHNFRITVYGDDYASAKNAAERLNAQARSVEELASKVTFTTIGEERPQPYFDEEIKKTVQTVRECITEPALIFPVVTDMHYQSLAIPTFDHFIENLKAFLGYIKCDFVANLGDNTDGSEKAVTLARNAYIANRLDELDIPLFSQIGNHDTNYQYKSGSNTLLQSEIFSSYLSYVRNAFYDMRLGTTPGTDTSIANNYYVDYDELNMRVVFLDDNHSLDTSNSDTGRRYRYVNRTVSWLRSILFASGTPIEKTVIVMEHMAPVGGMNVSGTSVLWGDIDNPSTGNDFVEKVFNDFGANGGKLIHICGHSHADYCCIQQDNGNNNLWMSIHLNCQKMEQADITTAKYATSITKKIPYSIDAPARAADTATEDCWSVIVVKPISHIVDVIRFGAGDDRHYDYNAYKLYFDVYFDTDNGSAVPRQRVEISGHPTEPDDPTKIGYTFGGWYADSAFTTAYDFTNDTITGTTTIYAKWTENT